MFPLAFFMVSKRYRRLKTALQSDDALIALRRDKMPLGPQVSRHRLPTVTYRYILIAPPSDGALSITLRRVVLHGPLLQLYAYPPWLCLFLACLPTVTNHYMFTCPIYAYPQRQDRYLPLQESSLLFDALDSDSSDHVTIHEVTEHLLVSYFKVDRAFVVVFVRSSSGSGSRSRSRSRSGSGSSSGR